MAIYDYDDILLSLLDNMADLHEKIWELAEKKGIPRTDDSAKMLTIKCNQIAHSEIIPNTNEVENIIAMLFSVYEISNRIIEDSNKYIDVKLKAVSDAWFYFGLISYELNGTVIDEDSLLKMGSTILGKKGAYVRHAETRSMREDAIDYWRKNIDPKLSAPKAANELIKIVPLSHRKLEEIIREEQKKS